MVLMVVILIHHKTMRHLPRDFARPRLRAATLLPVRVK